MPEGILFIFSGGVIIASYGLFIVIRHFKNTKRFNTFKDAFDDIKDDEIEEKQKENKND